MSVVRLESVRVSDDYEPSVSVLVILHDSDLSVERSTDSVTDVNFDVQAGVLTTPAQSVVRRHCPAVSRHREVSQVNLEFIRKQCCASVMSEVVAPFIVQFLCIIRLDVHVINELMNHERIDVLNFPVDRSLICQQVLSGC